MNVTYYFSAMDIITVCVISLITFIIGIALGFALMYIINNKCKNKVHEYQQVENQVDDKKNIE